LDTFNGPLKGNAQNVGTAKKLLDVACLQIKISAVHWPAWQAFKREAEGETRLKCSLG